MLFGSALSNPIVLTVICAIFFLMALSMYGVYEIQVPSFLRQISSKHKAGASYTGAYFSGIIAGVVASPCVGPVLVTLLTFVASTGNKVLGFFLLFDYAVGLGVIFLVLGLFTQLTKKLPRSGPWMDGMKFLLGSFMLGAFFYYLGFLIPQRIHDGLVGIAMIVVASFFGAFLNPNGNKLRRIQKGLMLGLLVVGFGFVVVASLDLRPQLTNQFTGPVEVPKVAADWQPYSEVLLAQAKAEGKPVVIDFFADWCLACHELDEKTFQIDEVKSALSGFYKLRFDATKESQELNDLRKKYGIQGLPTIIFIGKDGNWRQDLTLTEFEPPAKFLERLGKF
jgi:thiol:disulfide interchange protein DsbD